MASNEEKDKPHDSERMFDQVCSPCKCQERTTTAAKFCADCQDYYCLECVKVHNNFPALAGHSVLDIGHFKTGTSKPISMVPTERCESHNFKIVDMYCQNHDDIGCSTCIAVEHRSCQDVFYIPEYVQNNNLTIEFETVQRAMLSVVSILKDQLDNYQREVKRLHKRKEEEVEKIKSFRVQIDRKLDLLEKSSIDEIEKSYQALIKKMHIDICALTTSQEDVHSSQDRISSAGPNRSQRFVRTIRGKTAKDEAEKCMKEKIEECTRQDVVFECNEKLLSMLAEMSHFGKIIQKHVLCKHEGKRSFVIGHESDTCTCNIHSTCILPDGAVILADRSNINLKHLDPSLYIVDDVLKLSHAPWQVCTVENKEIAVSFGESKNILVVNVEGKLKKVKQINTDHCCFGIAHYNGNIYVTSNRTCFVYSKAGTKLKQFSEDQSGQTLFYSICKIAASYNGKNIYVTDSKYGLIVLKMDGTLVEKYNCYELKKPREICETNFGHVLVCGQSSNNIIQFAPNGEVVGKALSPLGKRGCQAVCFDRRRLRMIVGRENVNEIEVYELI